MKKHTKTIINLILLLIVAIYGYPILWYIPGLTLNSSIKEIMTVFAPSMGLLGLVGFLLLISIEDAKNKKILALTIIFAILGIFSALYVAYKGFLLNFGGIFGFLVTWGLLAFVITTMVYAKIKLFPKK